MKNLLLGTLIGLTFVQAQADARSLRQLEPITVKKVSLEGDFMPPVIGPAQPLTVLTLQVDSNGCTSAEDFKVVTREVASGKQLTIIRTQPDNCRAFFPEGREIQLTTGAVHFGDQVFIGNPVRVENNTTH